MARRYSSKFYPSKAAAAAAAGTMPGGAAAWSPAFVPNPAAKARGFPSGGWFLMETSPGAGGGRASNGAGNPARSASQYGAAQAVLSGMSELMPKKVARELVSKTPPAKREAFARELAKRRNSTAADYARWGRQDGQLGSLRDFSKADAGRRFDDAWPVKEKRDVRRSKAKSAYLRSFLAELKKPWGVLRNPEAEAAAVFEEFHGTPATGFDEVEVLKHEHSVLAGLGQLLELKVRGRDGKLTYSWPQTGSRAVRLCVSEDRGQLYLVGGDQEVNLSELGVDDSMPKDFVTVGEATNIEYLTEKGFHNFEPTRYTHKFGEETGEFPILSYDVRSKLLYFTDGAYRVTPEGIEN